MEIEDQYIKMTKVKRSDSSLGRLPYDLLFEILSILPLATLCQFKCVSTAWCSLIKTPVFVDRFRSETSFEPFHWVFGSWGYRDVEIHSVDRRGLTTRTGIHQLESEPYQIKFCDGLIFYTVRNSRQIHVYNLTTKEYVHLPLLNFSLTAPLNYAIGFDPSSNKYKVLCWNKRDDKKLSYQVISLGHGEVDSMWRPLQNILVNIGQLIGEPILSNGSLFWFKHESGDQQFTSFNLATEKFRMIALLNNINKFGFFTYTLFGSGDALYLAEQPQPRRPSGKNSKCHLNIANIWMLKNTVNNVWVTFMSNVTLPMEATTLRDYYFCYGSIRAPYNAQFSIVNGEIVVLANDHRHQYLFVYCYLSGFKRIKLEGQPLPDIMLRYHVMNHVRFNMNHAN